MYKITLLLCAGFVACAASNIDAQEAAGTSSMVFPKTDWEERSPESQGVDSAKLKIAVDSFGEIVVIRNGYMIYKGEAPDRMIHVASATKSFASTVLGHLIDSDKCTLSSRACEFIPALEKDYPDVTLRNFASMTSGYDAEGGNYGDDPDDGSRTTLVPTSPAFAPGTKFSYFDDAMRMFGYVLTRIADTDLDSYFREHIARPIGMKDAGWEWRTLPGDPLQRWNQYDWTNPYDLTVRDAAGGMFISAGAMARFGHLFLNRGNWDGKQIIGSNWVDEATKVQFPASMPGREDSRRQKRISTKGARRYGLNWWVNGIGKDGDRLFPDAPADLYYADGAGDNKCFVIPSYNMVVVRMGLEGTRSNSTRRWNDFFRLLLQAVSASPGENAS